MKLIVGLGNPGKRYEKTRHNVGFMVLDSLLGELSSYDIGSWDLSKKFNAYIAGCNVKGEKIILAKPLTFMNASGQTVQLIAHFYKMTQRDLIVVHDDKDLPLGTVKMQQDRGAAGHNGIKSIIQQIGSQDFTRVRVGIAAKNERKMKNTSKFVLGKFGLFEKNELRDAIERSKNNILSILEKTEA